MKTFVILLALVGLTLGATLHDIQKKLHEEKLKKRDDEVSMSFQIRIILYLDLLYFQFTAFIMIYLLNWKTLKINRYLTHHTNGVQSPFPGNA